MKTNSFNRKKSHNKGNVIFEKLTKSAINKIAKISGYKKRNRGKINALNSELLTSRRKETRKFCKSISN